jgi:hypothetical protein
MFVRPFRFFRTGGYGTHGFGIGGGLALLFHLSLPPPFLLPLLFFGILTQSFNGSVVADGLENCGENIAGALFRVVERLA